MRAGAPASADRRPASRSSPDRPRRRPWRLLAAAATGLAAIVVAPLGGLAGEPAAGPAACGHAAAVRTHLASLAFARQPVVTIPQDAAPAPNLAFRTADGAPTSLADMRGRMLLVNLWATWCAPCREEMPALDRLQARMGGHDFAVVAINVDQRLLDRPRQVLDRMGVSALAYHADPDAKVFADLKAIGRASGLPVSLLVDADGCELASVTGPAAWDTDDALTFIAAAKDRRR
jgi:thiol-disulfide isomerase/thioredoxin